MKPARIITAVLTLAILITGGFIGYMIWNANQSSIQKRMAKYGFDFSTVIDIDTKEVNEQGLHNPLGVTVDASGRIFVVDSSNNRIVIFNPEGNFDTFLGQAGSEPGQFRYPVAAVTTGNKLYVADLYNHRVQVFSLPGLIFNPQGKFIYSLPLPDDRKKVGAIRPLALAVDGKGDVYVADGSKQRIVVFSQMGKFLRQFGENGHKPGQFSFINGLAIDHIKKILYVADSNNGRIQTMTTEGKFLAEINGTAFGQQRFYPRGLALNMSKEILYVSDTLANKVYAYDLQAKSVKLIGVRSDGAKEYGFPSGLALDKSGNLYVTDRKRDRIVVYALGDKVSQK